MQVVRMAREERAVMPSDAQFWSLLVLANIYMATGHVIIGLVWLAGATITFVLSLRPTL